MTKKHFKIFAADRHEYDIFYEETDDGEKYSLFRSNSPAWTFPGELVISALDDGDSIKFSEKIGKEIDYSKLVELRILFNFINAGGSMLSSAVKYEAFEVPENPLIL